MLQVSNNTDELQMHKRSKQAKHKSREYGTEEKKGKGKLTYTPGCSSKQAHSRATRGDSGSCRGLYMSG